MSDPAPQETEGQAAGRRVQRTREAIRAAFNGLLLTRGYDGFSASDIAEAANVGRSTFYEHYQGKADVLATSLIPVLTPLAEACSSPAPHPRVEVVVSHFWDNRRMAKAMMTGRAQAVMAKQLARLIEDRLTGGDEPAAIPASLLAVQIAQGQLALIGEWLSGRHGCSAAQIAATLQTTAYAVVTANRVKRDAAK